VALQASCGLQRHTVDVYRSHTVRDTNTQPEDSSRTVVSPSQWELPTQQTEERNIQALSGIRIRAPSHQEDLDRKKTLTGCKFITVFTTDHQVPLYGTKITLSLRMNFISPSSVNLTVKRKTSYWQSVGQPDLCHFYCCSGYRLSQKN